MSFTGANNANLLFQSEMHPLVPLAYETESDCCLALIHKEVYARAAAAAAAAYLAEICRVLRPGGTALFTTPNRDIRLDPGMPPWNRFHVREYSAAGLRETLSGTFGDIAVEGLFAEPDLYAVEFNRVSKARQVACLPGFRILRRMTFLQDWARTIRRILRVGHGAEDNSLPDKW